MLMTSIQLQNGSDPLRPLPFLNVIEALNGSDAIEALVCSQDLPDSIPKPSRDHPEGLPVGFRASPKRAGGAFPSV